MATLKEWTAGARLRTLPMAVAPVLIGAAAVFGQPRPYTFGWLESHDDAPEQIFTGTVALHIVVALLALIVSLALQVGVNYANDYSDGVRGTDDERVGPMRLTGSGAAEPHQVRAAAFGSFGVAGLAGLIIVVLTGQWWLLGAGVICVLAAWWYTGGSKPYGYLGLGEIMVFIFFGLVATLGTSYAMVEVAETRGVSMEFPLAGALIGAVSHGLIASALLMANNVRDIPTDRESGKMTLAVRLGQGRARSSYALMVVIAVTLPLALMLQGPQSLWFLLVVASWPLCIRPIGIMVRRPQPARGPELIPVLQQTGTIGLAFAATYSAALLLS
ncbi:1,4-dihydroxy-2-naphthoate polyprenyltransferase [Nesterenkonia cremea]|uniref:1,4-dihydroxy-2-naphthoate octaprenyltransferase n=1 Tax=Nesterenkonia cremea TaxID=1882340 RepID=A0A917EQ75_9MICC|nr:1,4-dihydroxy-2-naphthoate polyprenyltransferase [Nesterenkonia cremea]GGE74299.1 1,4-dihydroxy-2-naphthoate octaprenyltransferase [Nesterenkonia cremea]